MSEGVECEGESGIPGPTCYWVRNSRDRGKRGGGDASCSSVKKLSVVTEDLAEINRLKIL